MTATGFYPTIVGILGRKRAGKSTVAARLIAEHGFTSVAMADPMRQALEALDPLVADGTSCACCADVEHLSGALRSHGGWEGLKDSPYADEVRRLMQRFGTEVGRDLWGEDFWIDQALYEIAGHDQPVVVPDIRFRNEAKAIEAAGGLLVRVDRPDLSYPEDTHPSEHDLDDFIPHLVIANTGPVNDVHRSVDDLARRALAS